jgi:hypothetical protein
MMMSPGRPTFEDVGLLRRLGVLVVDSFAAFSAARSERSPQLPANSRCSRETVELVRSSAPIDRSRRAD